jgi:choline transport protein
MNRKGWMSVLSWQANSAAGGYVAGTVIQGLAYINDPSSGDQQSAFTTAWQGTLLAIANVLIVAAANVWGARFLPLTQILLMVLHIVLFIALIAILWAMGQHVSASEVFGLQNFENLGRWSSIGLSLMVSQISAVYALTCSDSAAHLSEEVQDAGLTIPRSMIWSYIVNGAMGFVFVISFVFAIPNVQDALDYPAGYPFFYVFTEAMPTNGVTAVTVLGILLLIGGNISINTSTARQTFAFARDQGLPFSSWIAKVQDILIFTSTSWLARVY